jgi:hypothetical protein
VTYGGDSGNRIFVLYWRCSLIRVSVIRGFTVYISMCLTQNQFTRNNMMSNETTKTKPKCKQREYRI